MIEPGEKKLVVSRQCHLMMVFLGYVACASILLSPIYFIFWHSISGDASIYFTFIKNFFALPFSFQPGTISFGATSPLHVLLHAFIFLAVGADHWLFVSKILNYLFIPIGLTLLIHAVPFRNRLRGLLFMSAITSLNPLLFIASAQLYETSLAFASVALVYWLIKTRRHSWALLAAGSLYLVRPELLLVTLVIDLYVLAKLPCESRINAVLLILASFLLVVVYHLYLLIATGGFLPSSIYARALTSLENAHPWSERLLTSISTLCGSGGLPVLIGALGIMALFLTYGWQTCKVEMLFLIPFATLYTLAPPGGHLARYLLPVAPILAVLPAQLLAMLTMHIKQRAPYISTLFLSSVMSFFSLVILGTVIMHYYPYRLTPRYDYNTLLLRNLAYHLNPITRSSDKILLYEIQGQYYLKAFCVSLDGVVGEQIMDVLKGQETFSDFIIKNRVRFICTMNSFNYRRIYRGTLLQHLYSHDLESHVGDTVEINGIKLKKILTNPEFADSMRYHLLYYPSLNTGEAIRVYAGHNPLWKDHHFLWNSVYEIEHGPMIHGSSTVTVDQ